MEIVLSILYIKNMEFLSQPIIFAKSIPLSTYVKVFGTVSLVVLGWEHYGRKQPMAYRPSTLIESSAIISQNFFKRTGEILAWLSSYLTQIDLKEFGETLMAVGKPTCDLVVSPFYIFWGYVCKAANYGNKSWLVYVGSSLLAAVLSYGWYYLSFRYPFLNFWNPTYNYFTRN